MTNKHNILTMDTLKLPKPSSMLLMVKFTNKCDPRKLFETLPINDDIVSLKLKEYKHSDHHPTNQEEHVFLEILSGIQSCIKCDYVEIMIKFKSKYKQVKLYNDKAVLQECRSRQEGLKILNIILTYMKPTAELHIDKVETKLIRYTYKIPIDLNIDTISLHEDFKIHTYEKIRVIKYNQTSFILCGDIVTQSSINEEEAEHAFRALTKA